MWLANKSHATRFAIGITFSLLGLLSFSAAADQIISSRSGKILLLSILFMRQLSQCSADRAGRAGAGVRDRGAGGQGSGIRGGGSFSSII